MLFGSFACRNALLDFALQDVCEAIERAAERDAPGQFDNLGFGEMLAKPGENLVARLAPVVVYGDGIFDDEFVDGVEFRMILVVEQAVGARLRYALDRQFGRVARYAIVALVQVGYRDQRDLQMALRQDTVVGEIDQQRPCRAAARSEDRR